MSILCSHQWMRSFRFPIRRTHPTLRSMLKRNEKSHVDLKFSQTAELQPWFLGLDGPWALCTTGGYARRFWIGQFWTITCALWWALDTTMIDLERYHQQIYGCYHRCLGDFMQHIGSMISFGCKIWSQGDFNILNEEEVGVWSVFDLEHLAFSISCKQKCVEMGEREEEEREKRLSGGRAEERERGTRTLLPAKKKHKNENRTQMGEIGKEGKE